MVLCGTTPSRQRADSARPFIDTSFTDSSAARPIAMIRVGRRKLVAVHAVRTSRIHGCSTNAAKHVHANRHRFQVRRVGTPTVAAGVVERQTWSNSPDHMVVDQTVYTVRMATAARAQRDLAVPVAIQPAHPQPAVAVCFLQPRQNTVYWVLWTHLPSHHITACSWLQAPVATGRARCRLCHQPRGWRSSRQ